MQTSLQTSMNQPTANQGNSLPRNNEKSKIQMMPCFLDEKFINIKANESDTKISAKTIVLKRFNKENTENINISLLIKTGRLACLVLTNDTPTQLTIHHELFDKIKKENIKDIALITKELVHKNELLNKTFFIGSQSKTNFTRMDEEYYKNMLNSFNLSLYMK